MLQDDKIKLHGGAHFSQYSFCKDCMKPIIDMSRTRKRSRCENCSISHIAKIKHVSALRVAKEKREETKANKEKKEE